MKKEDGLLALTVVTLWGINFTVIRLGVSEVPPLLLVSLRYFFAAVPAVFFVRPPGAGWKYVTVYGLTAGAGQFACLFYAVHLGMPAGIASVLLQSQAFFTVLLAGILFRERVDGFQLAGLGIAGTGLFFLSGAVSGGGAIPPAAFLLTLAAAGFWSASNMVARKASEAAARQGRRLNMFRLVVWSSLVPPAPLLAAALLLDPPGALLTAAKQISGTGVFSVLYLSLLATLTGYGIWSTLIAKYPAGKVAPLSLLVPVMGLLTARIVLKEHLLPVQWAGCGIILAGLLLSGFGSRAAARLRKG